MADKPSKSKPSWDAFRKWAEENEVNLESKGDWLAWWECYGDEFDSCQELKGGSIEGIS